MSSLFMAIAGIVGTAIPGGEISMSGMLKPGFTWVVHLTFVVLLLVVARNSSAQAPALAGVTDPDVVLPVALLTEQPVGVPFLEPVFGTSLRRITDEQDRGGFGTQVYSQLQAFSPDNAHILLIESGVYTVRRLSDLRRVELDSSTWNAPRWHPTSTGTIVHYDSNDDTVLRVQYTDISDSTTTTMFTFPAEYQRIRGNQSFDELSRDGRWMSGLASRGDGEQVVFALDLEARALGAQLTIAELYADACQPDPEWGEVEPDWIGVSPLGNYLVVQWERDGNDRCSGLETFDLQTGEFVRAGLRWACPRRPGDR